MLEPAALDGWPPERLQPRIVEEHRAFVGELAERLTEVDVHRARATLRRMYGPVRARPEGEVVHLEIESGGLATAVLKAAGSTASNLVAGARSPLYLRPPPWWR